MPEEYGELLRERMIEKGKKEAIDFKSNVAKSIYDCITQGKGMPTFQPFVKQRMALMKCHAGEPGGHAWFNNIPMDDLEKMPQTTGDWKWILQKYGTTDQKALLKQEIAVPITVSPKAAQITSLTYDGYDGKVQVWYDDTDSQVDYFHFYTVRQKNAIEWIQRDGATVMTGEMVNYQFDHAKKALRFFKKVKRETGKRVIPKLTVNYAEYATLAEAKDHFAEAVEKFKEIDQKPRIFFVHIGDFTTAMSDTPYVIGSAGITWRSWKDVTDEPLPTPPQPEPEKHKPVEGDSMFLEVGLSSADIPENWEVLMDTKLSVLLKKKVPEHFVIAVEYKHPVIYPRYGNMRYEVGLHTASEVDKQNYLSPGGAFDRVMELIRRVDSGNVSPKGGGFVTEKNPKEILESESYEGLDGSYHIDIYSDRSYDLETPTGIAGGSFDEEGHSYAAKWQEPDIEKWINDLGEKHFGKAKSPRIGGHPGRADNKRDRLIAEIYDNRMNAWKYGHKGIKPVSDDDLTELRNMSTEELEQTAKLTRQFLIPVVGPSPRSSGPKALPVVTYKGKKYYMDRRLNELRNVEVPWEVVRPIPPDSEMEAGNSSPREGEKMNEDERRRYWMNIPYTIRKPWDETVVTMGQRGYSDEEKTRYIENRIREYYGDSALDLRQRMADQMIFTVTQPGDAPDVRITMPRTRAILQLRNMKYPLDELRRDKHGHLAIDKNLVEDWDRFVEGTKGFMFVSTRGGPAVMPGKVSPQEITGAGKEILHGDDGRITWKYNRYGHVEIWRGPDMVGESDIYIQPDYDVEHFFEMIGLNPDEVGIGDWDVVDDPGYFEGVSAKTPVAQNVSIPSVFSEYVDQFVAPHLGHLPTEDDLAYFKYHWDEKAGGPRMGYSELALHYRISGKAIKEVRWLGERWVEVLVDGKWWQGLPSELLPHELREVPSTIAMRVQGNPSNLQDIIRRENEYFKMYGGPTESDFSINDIQREKITAYWQQHPNTHVGLVNLHGRKDFLQKYNGEKVVNFEWDFIIPQHDAELLKLLTERVQAPYTGTKEDTVRIGKIYDKVEQLGGLNLYWA